MSLTVDQKEDLSLRMADLEKKLLESEEERCRLEKTCNVLMRAFKEEEKMRYKALNKKYEKFLEDCSVRKRRNDIILRSLCRIEDRSKVLFAKTERLRLLKDRYISYLKIKDVRKDELPPWRVSSNVTPKLIHTPYGKVDIKGDLLQTSSRPKTTSFDATTPRDRDLQKFESRMRENGLGSLSHLEPQSRRNGAGDYFGVGSPEPLINVAGPGLGHYPRKYEPSVSEMSNKCDDVSQEVTLKERSVISHQQSIETLKKTLMEEEQYVNHESRDDDLNVVVEKDRIEQSEKNSISAQNKSHDQLIPIISHNLTISSPVKDIYEEGKHEAVTKKEEVETKPVSPAADDDNDEEENAPSRELPMGLDGVDYDNETYPESYYEQPAHHNHVSIASDVILEEDEEQEEAENCGGGDFVPSSWGRAPELGTKSETLTKDTPEKQKQVDEVESESDKSKPASFRDEGAKSDGSEKPVPGKSNRSNLIHLLESDSESFQIEHGDAVSGNEDSEFDFSFA